MVHTVRDTETGEVLGFFPSVESVLLAAARGGWQNWVSECRHPTLDEMQMFFAARVPAGQVAEMKGWRNEASKVFKSWQSGEGNADPEFDD